MKYIFFGAAVVEWYIVLLKSYIYLLAFADQNNYVHYVCLPLSHKDTLTPAPLNLDKLQRRILENPPIRKVQVARNVNPWRGQIFADLHTAFGGLHISVEKNNKTALKLVSAWAELSPSWISVRQRTHLCHFFLSGDLNKYMFRLAN